MANGTVTRHRFTFGMIVSRYLERCIIAILTASALMFLATGEWSKLFVLAQAIVLSFIPFLLKKYIQFETPVYLRTGLIIFIFTTLFLGEIQGFYDSIWWWDLLLHATAGFGLTLVAYILIGIVYNLPFVVKRPVFTSLLAMSCSLAMGVLWEIYEFAVDSLMTNQNMQPSLLDTMTDIVIGFCAALVAGIIGWRWLKHRKQGPIEAILEDGVYGNEK